MRSLDIAGTGMLAQQTNVEVISNNIANMTTTGYKRRRAEFADLLYQDVRRVGSSSSDSGTVVPTGVQVGVGVKPTAVYRISEQGNLPPAAGEDGNYKSQFYQRGFDIDVARGLVIFNEPVY